MRVTITVPISQAKRLRAEQLSSLYKVTEGEVTSEQFDSKSMLSTSIALATPVSFLAHVHTCVENQAYVCDARVNTHIHHCCKTL